MTTTSSAFSLRSFFLSISISLCLYVSRYIGVDGIPASLHKFVSNDDATRNIQQPFLPFILIFWVHAIAERKLLDWIILVVLVFVCHVSLSLDHAAEAVVVADRKLAVVIGPCQPRGSGVLLDHQLDATQLEIGEEDFVACRGGLVDRAE